MKKAVLIISLISFMAIAALGYAYKDYGRNENLVSLGSVEMLSSDELLEIKRERHPIYDELLELSYSGCRIPYGTNEGCYYFPAYSGDMTACFEDGYDIAVFRSDDNKSALILVYDNAFYREYKIILTGLSLVNIEIPEAGAEEPVPDSYTNGYAAIFEYDPASNKIYAEMSGISMKIRGTSSTQYPKKNYSIKFMDITSNKPKIVKLFDFRPNTTFGLNSLYEDDSKIRDTLSLRLWERIGAGDNRYGMDNGIGIEYVEVLINNNYWGLYGFHEIINRYSLDAGDTDIIYKVTSAATPALQSYVAGKFYNVKIICDKSDEDMAWKAFMDFYDMFYYSDDAAFTSGIGAYIDRDNIEDYFLLTEFLFALDNCWKNLVYTYRPGDSVFILTPWDLDLTLGYSWNSDQLHNVEYFMEYSEMIAHNRTGITTSIFSRLWRCDVGGFRRDTARRWFRLRNGALSEESLLAQANGLYSLLTDTGARSRDAQRWPDRPSSADNGFIEKFIKARLKFLDRYYTAYKG